MPAARCVPRRAASGRSPAHRARRLGGVVKLSQNKKRAGQALPSLAPRYYSIASTPLDDPARCRVAFSVVRWDSPAGKVPPPPSLLPPVLIGRVSSPPY